MSRKRRRGLHLNKNINHERECVSKSPNVTKRIEKNNKGALQLKDMTADF